MNDNENEKQYEVDYKEINEADDLKLVSCTPVMAKRDLNPGVPETPFMSKNTLDQKDATPIIKGGIVIQKALPPQRVNMGAITFVKPATGPVAP